MDRVNPGFAVKYVYDNQSHGRELRQKEMEGSVKVLKKLGGELDECVREVVVARLETEEFKLATGIKAQLASNASMVVKGLHLQISGQA